MSLRVLLIIVNWNNYTDTRKCLNSLSVLNYKDLDTLVVDNGSTNSDVRKLEVEFPHVHFLYNESNLGYAGGANVGISFGIERKYDYIWLLNNDTIISDPQYLSILISASQEKGGGIIGSLVLNSENKKVQSGWFTFIPWRGRFVPIYKDFDVDSIKKVTLFLGKGEYINAASMLIRTDVFNRCGLWPELFFLYFEDNTWEDVARNRGISICYTSKTFLLHKGAASSGGYKKSTTLDYYDTRNYLYFIRESYPRWLWYHILKSIVNKIIPKIVRCEWIRLKYVLYGFYDFFKGRKGKFLSKP